MSGKRSSWSEARPEVFDGRSGLTNLHRVPERLPLAGRVHRFDHGEGLGVGAPGAAIGRESPSQTAGDGLPEPCGYRAGTAGESFELVGSGKAFDARRRGAAPAAWTCGEDRDVVDRCSVELLGVPVKQFT